jgi:hypothetical protein
VWRAPAYPEVSEQVAEDKSAASNAGMGRLAATAAAITKRKPKPLNPEKMVSTIIIQPLKHRLCLLKLEENSRSELVSQHQSAIFADYHAESWNLQS